MDEPFDGKIDVQALMEPQQRFVETASLRSIEEIQTARGRVELWHWRARQLALQRQGFAWPPKEAGSDAVADLRNKGLDTLDGVVRATTRTLYKEGVLDEVIDDDFVAKGKAYRDLSEQEASELMSIALERHKALNWLYGRAPRNDWASVPLET